jgi:DNA-binding transcriptional LysR family regulator
MRWTHSEGYPAPVTQLHNADLNLLKALAVMLEERHVSRAAERLHLSQPAMSRTLQRLRETFDDELLVRTRGGYEPTTRGHRIQSELAEILPRLEALLRGNAFDPATATGEFRVHCTDFATGVLGPAVFQRAFSEAPRISLNLRPLSDRSFAEVEQGRADLVISGVVAPKTLRWETLFEEDFVCLVAADHPITGDRLTLADFARYPHVVISVFDEEQTMVDRPLADLGLRRTAGLRVPYFSAATLPLPGTDLITTLPRRGATPYLDDPAFRVTEAPVEIQSFPYGIAWHPRVDGDPAHQWLRGLLRDAATDLAPRSTARR